MSSKSTAIGRRRNTARKGARASYENRRAEISEAAVRVFHKKGYQGASLSAVAAELGIDRASIYYYFSSKEQMFDEIIRSVVEGNNELTSRIAESAISPARKIRELVVTLMVSYAENYPLLYVYISEDLKQVSDRRSSWSETMRELNRSIERSLIKVIEEGYADGSFRRIGSARTVAYGILGMLNWTHRWFKPGRSETPEEIGKTFAEFALSGLESPY